MALTQAEQLARFRRELVARGASEEEALALLPEGTTNRRARVIRLQAVR